MIKQILVDSMNTQVQRNLVENIVFYSLLDPKYLSIFLEKVLLDRE